MDKVVGKERYGFFDEVQNVFNNPDEVWAVFKGSKSRKDKEEFFNTYIKYYYDKPVVLLVNQAGRVDSFYKLDSLEQCEQFRLGVLKNRKR